MDAKWRAFSREAASAAEHLAFGATILGRADYAHDGYYAQAFLALSTGFERSAKLAILLDHALDHSGAFPSTGQLKRYQHHLEDLFNTVESIDTSRCLGVAPAAGAIHVGILKTLSDFARNGTRYYNLEVLTGDMTVAMRDDPIAQWHTNVTQPVITAHLSAHRRSKLEQDARTVAAVLGDSAIVRYRAESGDEITDVFSASVQTALTDAAKPWERMYVLQLARFVSGVIVALGDKAFERSIYVPALVEFFGIFMNDDLMFRTRKTWSIYS